MTGMAGGQRIDQIDDGLEHQLRELLEQIRREPVPAEIRILAGKLEAALQERAGTAPEELNRHDPPDP